MTPAAQPQPPQSTSPVIAAPSVSPSLKFRFLLYIVGGFILLTVITIISLKIAPPFLQKKAPPKSTINRIVPEVSYPIYPDAVFIESEKAPSCEEAPARGECGQTASIWQTSDSLDKVLNWYKSDHDGWRFEPFNDQDPSNNPVFGYLENETDLLYTEFYKNSDGTTAIKIFNQS